MDAADIEGAKPGWRSRSLFADRPRDPMQKGAEQQAAGMAGRRQGSSNSPPEAAAGALPGGSAPPPEYGVARTTDWNKRRLEVKVQQAGAARRAMQAAEGAIATAAATAAAHLAAVPAAPTARQQAGQAGGPPAGLAGVIRSLKALDRDSTGRVQVSWCEKGCGRAMEQHPAVDALGGIIPRRDSNVKGCASVSHSI